MMIIIDYANANVKEEKKSKWTHDDDENEVMKGDESEHICMLRERETGSERNAERERARGREKHFVQWLCAIRKEQARVREMEK